ncbi:MAG: hypothetical protein U0Q22_15590 [Acidimicrobiales bacterium]
MPFAAWAADPSGRYPRRYWDGTAWTAQIVSTDGHSGEDPAGPHPAPEPPKNNAPLFGMHSNGESA